MKFSKTWIYKEWYFGVCRNASGAFLYYFGATVMAPPMSPKTG